MRGGGTVNADGFGIGWFPEDEPGARPAIPARDADLDRRLAGRLAGEIRSARCSRRCATPPSACRSSRRPAPRSPTGAGCSATTGGQRLAGLPRPAGVRPARRGPADPRRPHRRRAALGAGPAPASRRSRPRLTPSRPWSPTSRPPRRAPGSTCCSPTARPSWHDLVPRPVDPPHRGRDRGQLGAVGPRRRHLGRGPGPHLVVATPQSVSTRALDDRRMVMTDSCSSIVVRHRRRRRQGAASPTPGRASRPHPKWLPPKWFYDARGSELFEDITRLAEYYPTRAEREILDSATPTTSRSRTAASTLVELGSGSSEKTRLLLTRCARTARCRLRAARRLRVRTARGRRGHRRGLPRPGHPRRSSATSPSTSAALPGEAPRLVAFLGGTIGNLLPAERATFLAAVRAGAGARRVAAARAPTWSRTPRRLVRAYDDAAGRDRRVQPQRAARPQPRAGRRLRRSRTSSTWPSGTPSRSGSRCGSGDQRGHRPGRGRSTCSVPFEAGRGDPHRDLREVPARGGRGRAVARRLRPRRLVDRYSRAASGSPWRARSDRCPPTPGNAVPPRMQKSIRACRRAPSSRGGWGSSVQCLSGGVLLSHTVPSAVPSALKGLASGFGMEPGVSPSL